MRPKEVGHGHVTYAETNLIRFLYGGFCAHSFLSSLYDYLKENRHCSKALVE